MTGGVPGQKPKGPSKKKDKFPGDFPDDES